MVKINNSQSVTETEMLTHKTRASMGVKASKNFLHNLASSRVNSLKSNALSMGSSSHSFQSLRNSIDDLSITDDYMYIRAELLIDLIVSGGLTISRLTMEQKIILFSYFYKYDKKMGRIVDLFTELPLSTLRLQKPSNATNDILQDYVYDFFNRMWDNVDFKTKLKKVFLYSKLYGFGSLLISDDYTDDSDTIIDFNDLKKMVQDEIEEEEWEDIKSITSLYNDKPNEVPYKDKSEVIKKLIKNINPDYVGAKFLQVIDPFVAVKRKSNLDINYHAFQLRDNANISQYLGSDIAKGKKDEEKINALASLGYSKSYVRLFLKTAQQGATVDSNPYFNKGCYIVSLEGEGLGINDKSSFNRVLQSAIDLKIVRDRERFKSKQSYKVNRVVTVPDGSLGPEDIAQLEAKIIDSTKNPEGTLLVTNYDIQWSEFSMDAREQVDLSGVEEKAERDIYSSFGMPDALIGGDDSYANSFMKMEMMTNEFQSVRLTLKKFVEDLIFKPIAIKKGFVITDDWGKPSVIYPSLKFDRITIARGTEDFSLLQDLAMSNKIPWKTLIEALNFDYEEVQSELKRERMSMMNEAVGGIYDDAMGDKLSEKLLESEEFTKKIADLVGVKEVEDIPKDIQDNKPEDKDEKEATDEKEEDTPDKSDDKEKSEDGANKEGKSESDKSKDDGEDKEEPIIKKDPAKTTEEVQEEEPSIEADKKDDKKEEEI